VTLGDAWGQGAHSALPMVGAFYEMALRARVIDPDALLGPETRASRKPQTQQHRRFLFWPF